MPPAPAAGGPGRPGHGGVRGADHPHGAAARRGRHAVKAKGDAGIATTIVDKLKDSIDGVGDPPSRAEQRVERAAGRGTGRAAGRTTMPTRAEPPIRRAPADRRLRLRRRRADRAARAARRRCRRRTSSTWATRRASPTASARAASSRRSRCRSPRSCWPAGRSCWSSRATRRRPRRCPALRRRMMETTLGVDVLGVVRPEAVHAVTATRNGRIGLLATPTTVISGAYAAGDRRRRSARRPRRRRLPGPRADHPGRVPLRRGAWSRPSAATSRRCARPASTPWSSAARTTRSCARCSSGCSGATCGS